MACLRELQRIAPNAFADFSIGTLADGTEVAASPLVRQLGKPDQFSVSTGVRFMFPN